MQKNTLKFWRVISWRSATVFLYSTSHWSDECVFLGVVCGLGFFDFLCFDLVWKIVSCVRHLLRPYDFGEFCVFYFPSSFQYMDDGNPIFSLTHISGLSKKQSCLNMYILRCNSKSDGGFLATKNCLVTRQWSTSSLALSMASGNEGLEAIRGYTSRYTGMGGSFPHSIGVASPPNPTAKSSWISEPPLRRHFRTALLEAGWIFKVLLIRNFEWKAKGANTHVFFWFVCLILGRVFCVYEISPKCWISEVFFGLIWNENLFLGETVALMMPSLCGLWKGNSSLATSERINLYPRAWWHLLWWIEIVMDLIA